MERRTFLYSSSLASLGSSLFINKLFKNPSEMKNHKIAENINPLAFTMWDFSWIERRWTGAGYENWDLALQELVERGYNAVRIDAYPHLVSADQNKKWTIKWELDELNRRIPFIIGNHSRWRINNLHIHCKRVKEFI